jgi:hypothetical protein
LKTKSTESKQTIPGQKTAANSTASKGTSLPAVSVLQPMQKHKVAQLYSAETFGKLSKGQQILLQSNYKLFASSSKISEANGVEGDVGFKAGEDSEHVEGLKEVIAFVKVGSTLENDMKGYDPSEEFKGVKPNAIRKLPDKDLLKDEYRDIISDHVNEGENLTPEVSLLVKGRDLNLKENRLALLKELVDAALKQLEGVERPAIEKRVDDYLEKQVKLKARPLLPSDCRAMASYVAGFDAGSGGEDVTHLPVEAGDVYEYTAPDQQKGEWPFHYATVIMTDGEDHVTMENAAAKASDKFSKMQYDHSWFFEMYGTKKGQSFEDHYKPLLDPE